MKSFAEWRVNFAEVDACGEPVLTISEAAEHPQLKARGMVIELDGTCQRQIGHPIKFETTGCESRFVGRMDNDDGL